MSMGRVKITLFGVLARITGEKVIYANAPTLRDAINEAAIKYGEEFKSRILDEKGGLRRFINVYVNGRNVRFLNDLETKLNDNDVVWIIPAVGGGSNGWFDSHRVWKYRAGVS